MVSPRARSASTPRLENIVADGLHSQGEKVGDKLRTSSFDQVPISRIRANRDGRHPQLRQGSAR